VKLASAAAVWLLATYGKQIQNELRRAGVLPHVVALLANPIDECILQAAGCIRNLATNNSKSSLSTSSYLQIRLQVPSEQFLTYLLSSAIDLAHFLAFRFI
jgi:hypothetical protein